MLSIWNCVITIIAPICIPTMHVFYMLIHFAFSMCCVIHKYNKTNLDSFRSCLSSPTSSSLSLLSPISLVSASFISLSSLQPLSVYLSFLSLSLPLSWPSDLVYCSPLYLSEGLVTCTLAWTKLNCEGGHAINVYQMKIAKYGKYLSSWKGTAKGFPHMENMSTFKAQGTSQAHQTSYSIL